MNKKTIIFISVVRIILQITKNIPDNRFLPTLNRILLLRITIARRYDVVYNWSIAMEIKCYPENE